MTAPLPASSSPINLGQPQAARPELLSPAGDWECARAAVANGADAIYFGLPSFNARIRATNFTEEDLPKLMEFLHQHEVKGYVAFNTLIFPNELAAAAQQLVLLHQAGVDAAIVQDVGLCALARELVPDFHIHASTQMTLTSPEGLGFAARLGISRAVLARELSLRELAKFRTDELPSLLPLEIFVHGALCVAYSGQCLTSEALGQRSANRGECAQACRLPYDLVVDGKTQPLGDRRYLLSPQDLAAVEHIPDLIRLGISSFKIEGRLKTPEYVAAVTQVYRKAIDQCFNAGAAPAPMSEADRYQLEMAFSRGLYSGWLEGVNHQELVHARFGKKRGAFLGRITRVGRDFIEVATSDAPLELGDGVVIDTGADTDHEQGGRVYEIKPAVNEHNVVVSRLFFEHGKIAFDRVKPGDRLWKTSDPRLDRTLRQTFQNPIPPKKIPLHFRAEGAVGSRLKLSAWVQGEPIREVAIESEMPLQAALKRPLTEPGLKDQLGRLGDTPFALASLEFQLVGEVILPVSELNRLRRSLVDQIIAGNAHLPTASVPRAVKQPEIVLKDMLQKVQSFGENSSANHETELVVLCRNMEQIRAGIEARVSRIYVDFEDIRRYREAVELVRATPNSPLIFLATPRIHKAGETGVFRLIEKAEADGILVRNLGALDYFRSAETRRILTGDFSLNVANPLTAAHFMQEGLNRLTVSYDLNAQQVLDLLATTPARWLEITLHQHIPMFHMEHCVFAAFLSEGTDHTNCGRPCDRHQVELRDRVGLLHPVKADVGCRNTVYHAQSQSGAAAVESFAAARPAAFRIELLGEGYDETLATLEAYRELLRGEIDAPALLRRVKARNQLGVTVGI